MRIALRFIAVVLLGLWIAGLSISIPNGNRQLPPLGSFLSPFTGFLQQAEPVHDLSILKTEQAGLSNGVQVHFDERQVPHIFAQSSSDAYQVLGYLHAKHRLFQMDLVSRATAGRLSELLGPRLIARDRLQRKKGITKSAELAVKAWQDSPSFAFLEAYAAGYNEYLAGLQKKDYPLEFKLMNYEPEPWTPYRTSLLLKSMAQSLCARNHDIAASNTREKIGWEMFFELYPNQMSIADPIIPASVEYPFIPLLPDNKIEIPNMEDLIDHTPLENPPVNIGSNNWAVSGSKTKSGHPILANDPHLQLTLPSIWYEAHIITPEVNTYGVTLPGYPGIVIGFNENIAWGLTNVGQDVTDWYTIDWVDKNKESYWLDGEKTPVEWRIEKINIKGQPPIVDSVKYTYWGPVVLEANEKDNRDLAMHWLPNLSPNPQEIEMFSQLNSARNFDEFIKSTQKFQTPPQNVVFASSAGDIAMRISGKFPLKRKGQGQFVVAGNETKNGWQGFIPGGHNPAMLNPERGFVSSANQKSTGKNYPYHYNGRFEQYRGRMLNQQLSKMEAIDIDDMRQLQNNNYSLKAEELVPILLRHLNSSILTPDKMKWVDELKKWDFKYTPESQAATFFELWFSALRKDTWDEMQALPDGPAMLRPQDWKLRDLLDQEPEHIIFDLQSSPAKETAEEVVNLSFASAAERAAELEQNNSMAWRKYNPLTINHLSRIPAFGLQNVAANGSPHCLNANNRTSGPSWRMVVELGPEQKAYGVLPGGQSGNPGSPFYDTGIEKWTKGELFKLHFVKQPNELKDPLLIHHFNPAQ